MTAAKPDAQDIRDKVNALSGVMMAAAFVTEPGVWAAFTAFVERTIGRDFGGTAQGMERAILITDAMRISLAELLGQDPGSRYSAGEPQS